MNSTIKTALVKEVSLALSRNVKLQNNIFNEMVSRGFNKESLVYLLNEEMAISLPDDHLLLCGYVCDKELKTKIFEKYYGQHYKLVDFRVMPTRNNLLKLEIHNCTKFSNIYLGYVTINELFNALISGQDVITPSVPIQALGNTLSYNIINSNEVDFIKLYYFEENDIISSNNDVFLMNNIVIPYKSLFTFLVIKNNTHNGGTEIPVMVLKYNTASNSYHKSMCDNSVQAYIINDIVKYLKYDVFEKIKYRNCQKIVFEVIAFNDVLDYQTKIEKVALKLDEIYTHDKSVSSIKNDLRGALS